MVETPHAVAFNHIQDPVSSPSVGTTLGEEGQAVLTGFDPTSSSTGAAIGIAPTLRTGHHSSSGHHAGVSDGAAVRRLTPTECARWQGFPDDWNCLRGAQPYSTSA